MSSKSTSTASVEGSGAAAPEMTQKASGTPMDRGAVMIPAERWAEFLDDFSRRRYGWLTRIEILDKLSGAQVLSDGLSLNGVVLEDRLGHRGISISVGSTADRHESHSVGTPVAIGYLAESGAGPGALEIFEEDETITLVNVIAPMPVVFGYASFEVSEL